MNNYSNKIAITTGDPNGIGAEITIKALNLLNLPPKDIVIISNSKILNAYSNAGFLKNNYEIIEIDYSEKVVPGEVSANAGDFAFRALEKACKIKPKFIVSFGLNCFKELAKNGYDIKKIEGKGSKWLIVDAKSIVVHLFILTSICC